MDIRTKNTFARFGVHRKHFWKSFLVRCPIAKRERENKMRKRHTKKKNVVYSTFIIYFSSTIPNLRPFHFVFFLVFLPCFIRESLEDTEATGLSLYFNFFFSFLDSTAGLFNTRFLILTFYILVHSWQFSFLLLSHSLLFSAPQFFSFALPLSLAL